MKYAIRHFVLTLASALAASSAMAGGTHGSAHDDDSAIGKAGNAAKVSRTIQVTMNDNMRFSPPLMTAKQGETIRFVVKNVGRIKHEFSLGTEAELKEHYEMMKKFPDMEHDEPNKISLPPGHQGEVIWQFTHAGTVNFACLHPGHYEAGMKGRVKVSKG